MTTVLLSGITIDNQAYQVRQGQKVEMLIINTNANIPTTIASSTMIEEYKEPMGDMAVDIATNTVLKDRVRAFLEEDTTTKPQPPTTTSLGNMAGVLVLLLLQSFFSCMYCNLKSLTTTTSRMKRTRSLRCANR